MLMGRHGPLNDEQREYLQTIQDNALQAFSFNQRMIQHYGTNGLEGLSEYSHDWLTPIASIISYCDLLLLEYLVGDLQDEQKALLQKAYYRAHALQRQIQNVIDYSRLEAHLERPMSSFPLDEVFKQDAIIVQSSVPIHWELPEYTPVVMSSKLYISHTLNALLDNAAKFTRAGYITVTGQVINRHVDITVTDTGIGIPHTLQDRVFQPFYQLTPRTPGLGLGLYIAQAYVAQQGSRLLMHSTPDVGTQFQFSIPLSDQQLPKED